MRTELHRRCPVCDADDTGPHWTKSELRLVECRRCSMVYANPIAEELASGEFYDQLAAPYYLSPDKLEGDYASARFERELRLFRRFCPRGEVLDVGCSTGGFLFQLLRGNQRTEGRHSCRPCPAPAATRMSPLQAGCSYAVTGVDVAGGALDYAEGKGIEVIRGPFLEQDFGGRQFDAVTFWAVLEHLAEPKRFLRRAAALVRPGGCCFALVPNLNSLAVRLLGARYRYIMPEHLNYFDATTLRALAAGETSLPLVALRSTHFNPAVIWQDVRADAGHSPSEAERAHLLRRTTALKQSPWLRPLRWVYGGVERALGAFRLADNLVMVLRKS